MPKPPTPDQREQQAVDGGVGDPARIAHARRLVDHARKASVDRLALLAARLTGAPNAQLSILTDRQVVAAIHGLVPTPAEREGPLEASLCTVTVSGGAPLAIDDARADARVSDLPPVTSGTVGAYLGVPVVADGHTVGALCVFGPEPREWTDDHVAILTALAEAIAAELQLGGLEADVEQTAVRLDLGYAAADIGSFDWNLVTDELHWDDRLKELFGYTDATFVPHIDSFTTPLHPDDRARVDAAVRDAVDSCGEYGTEFRVIRPGGDERWIAARGRVLCDRDGQPARMLGAAYDTTARHETGERLTRVLETMASAFFSLDHEWRFTYVNARAEQLLARGRDELLGKVVWDEFGAALDSTFEEQYRHAMAHRVPVSFEAYYPAPLDAWYEVRAWPSTEGLSVFFHDVTARVAAERERTRAHERLEAVAAASSRLASTLEADEMLALLGELLVPRFGAWIAVAVRSDVAALLGQGGPAPGSDLRVVHVASADASAGAALGDALVGTSVVADDALGVLTAAAARALGRKPVLRASPLRSRDRTIGLLVVGDPPTAGADEELLDDMGIRAGVALDNAVLFSAERQVGIELQHLLLPAELPQLPGIATAARYLPGTAGREVGGDFYLAQELDDGRLVIAIGDVMGHGMAAAARMGQLRAVLTAYAVDGDPPDRVLSRVARRAEDLLDVRMATVLVLVYDPAARCLTAASAGHPPPLVAPLHAPPAYVELTPGPPIGVGPSDYACVSVDIPPGTTIALYTDGLVENRGESLEAGLERLRDALSDIRLPPDRVADHVLAKMGRTAGAATDDVALLVFSHL